MVENNIKNNLLTNEKKIFVSGHKGLVGSSVLRYLDNIGHDNVCIADRGALDLKDKASVESFISKQKPDYIILSAAKVGGIHANNTYPVDFIYDNLCIQNNVIDAAYRLGVSKLVFLGSSCIYPKFATQPIKESELLTGALEPTNEYYAIAKIAGIKLAQAYKKQYGFNTISLMPTNLYGPGDNFNLENSHVLPALIRKFHEAKITGKKEVVVWGTGKVKREFLYVDDLAQALIYFMQSYSGDDIVNIGAGTDVSISGLAYHVKEIVGFNGNIIYDTSKPDGTPRKLLDVSLAKSLGWQSKTSLHEGIKKTYSWFVGNAVDIRK